MKRATRLRAVVFDLDGTLIDSLSLVLQAIGHAIEPFGPRPAEDIFARLGGPPERFLAKMLGDPGHVPVALERMDAYHRQNSHLIRPFAGAERFLERLKVTTQLAIWTGRDRESTDQLLREHRLGDYFSVVLCGDDLPSHKPDPEGLQAIMRRLGVTARETLFVGDADVDVLGGVACGVDTVLIRRGRSVATDVAAQSWQIVDSPGEAFDLVLNCLG